MATAESRTTKRARALVSDTRVSVAVPAELVTSENEPTERPKRGFKALLTSSIGPSADAGARVLAFTRNGTLIMTTKKGNGGIPDQISAEIDAFPEVIDDSGHELVIQLDSDTYRVGAIHRDTALSAIDRSLDIHLEPDPAPAEVASTDVADIANPILAPYGAPDIGETNENPVEDIRIDEEEAHAEARAAEEWVVEPNSDLAEADAGVDNEDDEEVLDVEAELEAALVEPEVDAADPTDDSTDAAELVEIEAEVEPHPDPEPSPADPAATAVHPGPKPETNPGVRAAATAATSGMTSASIAASLKRTFLTDEFGEIEIETRSRPTMQCQRLLRDRYVYLAVPGKALPREGSDDPKGKFVLAFTDQDVMLFKPSRGNEALPRDVIGPIDSGPTEFEPAGYNNREGGFLTVGNLRYLISRPYVKSVMSYIAEHHGGPQPLP